jgi:hypothetical protein
MLEYPEEMLSELKKAREEVRKAKELAKKDDRVPSEFYGDVNAALHGLDMIIEKLEEEEGTAGSPNYPE